MSFGVVYMIRNLVNGKIYIGQTTRSLERRFTLHARHSRQSAISSAIRKYGKESFSIKELCKCRDQDELNRMEELYIERQASMWPSGYNLRPGGNQSPITEEAKRKIGLANAGRTFEPGVYEKRTAHFRGRTRPDEERKKISESLKGRNITWGDKIAIGTRSALERDPDRRRRFVEAGEPYLSIGRALSLPGESNPNAKLTWDKVREIRRAYREDIVSQQALAERFGIKQTAISRVVRGVSWQED